MENEEKGDGKSTTLVRRPTARDLTTQPATFSRLESLPEENLIFYPSNPTEPNFLTVRDTIALGCASTKLWKMFNNLTMWEDLARQCNLSTKKEEGSYSALMAKSVNNLKIKASFVSFVLKRDGRYIAWDLMFHFEDKASKKRSCWEGLRDFFCCVPCRRTVKIPGLYLSTDEELGYVLQRRLDGHTYPRLSIAFKDGVRMLPSKARP